MFRVTSAVFLVTPVLVASEYQASIFFFRLLVVSIFSQPYELSQIKKIRYSAKTSPAALLIGRGSYFDLLMLM